MRGAPRAKVLVARPKPGALPGRSGALDPDTPLDKTEYRKAKAAFAMPAEAYEFELVYTAFRADTEFWKQWKVVDCARRMPEVQDDPMADKNKPCIRVVMDLPQSQKVYPVVYTPSLPARLAEGDPLAALPAAAPPPAPPAIAGGGGGGAAGGGASPEALAVATHDAAEVLSSGASIGLEVHKLEEARRLLSWSRHCNDGEVDPAFRWLEDIVNAKDGAPEKAAARAKHKSRPSHTRKASKEAVAHLALIDSEVRKTDIHVQTSYSEALRGFSDLYGTE